MIQRVETTIGGQTLTVETGRVAGQANGAVIVRFGDTMVLVTACMSKEPREGIDFFPLTVDFEEKMYAAGKIPGGFIKREGRPSQDAILAGRLADRPLRPLFPKGMRNDVQIVATVLSADQENDPDVLGIVGASAALSISDIPFAGPVSAVRVGYVDGEYVANPTMSTLARSELDLVVAGTREAIVMVEAGARELDEARMIGALKFAQEVNHQLIELQDRLVQLVGKPKAAVSFHPEPSAELREQLGPMIGERLREALNQPGKIAREDAVSDLKKEFLAQLDESIDRRLAGAIFDAKIKEFVRDRILNEGRRPDGRALTEVRTISCEVGLLPRTHGSGLFTRGQTQVLTTATLGSLGDEQMIDGIGPEESKRFMHHYNFPPFSVGETRPLRGPGRREIGHGALAERAIAYVVPGEDSFPYTIRLVSEVLSSNGSTSMGSVCGSTLALMDAGVPVKAPVGGVAMGLVVGPDGRYAVLTDIQGMEDALGDMDFKVAGSEAGITALQMDIKVKGITFEVIERALEQAREGRLFILRKMLETIDAARPELSRFAPRMYKIQIPVDKIRNVIGPGGKMIRSIIEETKATIDVEDDGTVVIGSANEDMARKAIGIIEGLTREVEVGTIYTGKVTRTTPFGAFVEVLPGKEGLVHISELADYRVPSVEDVVKIGDEIMVMVTEIDRLGRINLSRRAVLEGEAAAAAAASEERRPERPEGPESEQPERPERRPERPEGRSGFSRGGFPSRGRDGEQRGERRGPGGPPRGPGGPPRGPGGPPRGPGGPGRGPGGPGRPDRPEGGSGLSPFRRR